MYIRTFLPSTRTQSFALLVYFSVLALETSLARAYDLCTCNQLTCNNPIDCIYGVVLDQCGCCMMCARGKGDSCGGGSERSGGVCGKGLQCVIRAQPGDMVTGNEQGSCQGTDYISVDRKTYWILVYFIANFLYILINQGVLMMIDDD